MTDERFEEFLQDAAQDYNVPPTPPVDEMWTAIDQARGSRRGLGPRRNVQPWLWMVAGIAAILALGIGIGLRMGAAPAVPDVTTAVIEPAGDDDIVFRMVAVEYLERTDAFLSVFQSEASLGQPDAELGDWASDLLSTARLMIDSPIGDDPNLRVLLEDLELVLAQIAQYTQLQDDNELDLIEEGLEEQGLMLRLRAALTPDAEVVQGEI